MYRPNLNFIVLPVPGKKAIAVFEGFEPQSWGRGGRRGSKMVPFERAFYFLYSSIFTRFRAAFVLQHATFSHSTSSLPKISPYSPTSRWMAFGLRRAKMFS